MNWKTLNDEVLNCRKCPRLVAWREETARTKRRAFRDQDYWGKPVPGFGDVNARVFVIGLAPGAHGSNRTGRQFTGDASGDFLYAALHRAGFASQALSISREDGLVLTDLYTAPVCRCVPPDNKPTTDEIAKCSPFLEAEIDMIRPQVFVALGRIAFDVILAFLKETGEKIINTDMVENLSFKHGAAYQIGQKRWLVSSYHPSRQNTQTGRLTTAMFDDVWSTVREILEGGSE